MTIEKRMMRQDLPIDETVKKNTFPLPGCPEKGKGKTSGTGAPSSKINSSLLTKLRSSAVYRRDEVSKVFSSEVDGVSRCLSKGTDDLYHGSKSDILSRFETTEKPDLRNNHSCMIIELSLVVKSNSKIKVKTFNDYAKFIMDRILKLGQDCSRIDEIADRYFKNSLKSGVRKNRGKGSRKLFTGDAIFPSNFDNDFLFNDDNKNDLYYFLADFIITTYDGTKIIVVTKGESIVTNDASIIENENEMK